MKKISLFTVAALAAILMFVEMPSAEARGHRGSHVSVGVGVSQVYAAPTVVRRYARPVVMAPVFTPPPSYYYNPYETYYAPVYVQHAPVYVEEVYVAPRPCFGLGGLSFSWNWFR